MNAPPPTDPTEPPTPGTVAIVGAGFSGTLLAVQLLAQTEMGILLIERNVQQVGAGVAYSTDEPLHLLNVRAGNMSAFPDRPDHFRDWLAERHGGNASDFASRQIYGDYLRETLIKTATRFPGRLKKIDGEVVAAETVDGRLLLLLGDGREIWPASLALTIGNLPPHDPVPGLRQKLPPHLYLSDPWAAPQTAALDTDAHILLIGTGLTTIDVSLRLFNNGFAGHITALSRRGLRPHRHIAAQPSSPQRLERPAQSLSALTAWVRREARGREWRSVVDSLRPVTQMLWSSFDVKTRRRFLRHLRPYWDIHRHRIAPPIAERIDGLIAEGRLRFIAGKTIDFEMRNDSVQVTWRPRGEDKAQTLDFDLVINCTGPQGDVERSDEPLVRQLLGAGIIRPDALNLGIDTDVYGHVIGSDGTPHEQIMAVGPMTRGGLWEVVAVPDIRTQVAAIARRLGNCHWVGGEGL